MTDFISKLRMLLNRISQRLKIPMIKISVHCMANGKQNRFFALDPHNWAKQGIVDDIVAYPIAITAPNVKTLSAGKVVDIDVDYYVESVKNTRCRLFIDMLPREMEPEEYRKRALEYYHKGVYGLCFWDSNARHTKLRQWSIVRRLGHIQELEGDNMEEGIFYKTIEVKSIGGIRVDRFPPVWGL